MELLSLESPAQVLELPIGGVDGCLEALDLVSHERARDQPIVDDDARRQKLRRADSDTLGRADALEPLHAAESCPSYLGCAKRHHARRRRPFDVGDLSVMAAAVRYDGLRNGCSHASAWRREYHAACDTVRFESSSSSWSGPPAHCSEIHRMFTEFSRGGKPFAFPTAHVVRAQESYLNLLRQFRQTNRRRGCPPFKGIPSSKSWVR